MASFYSVLALRLLFPPCSGFSLLADGMSTAFDATAFLDAETKAVVRQKCLELGVPFVDEVYALQKEQQKAAKGKQILALEGLDLMRWCKTSRGNWWRLPDITITFDVQLWVRGPNNTLVANYTFQPEAFDMSGVKKPKEVELSVLALRMLERPSRLALELQ